MLLPPGWLMRCLAIMFWACGGCMTILWNQHLAVVAITDLKHTCFSPACNFALWQVISDHTWQLIWVDYYQFHCPQFSLHGFVACQVSFTNFKFNLRTMSFKTMKLNNTVLEAFLVVLLTFVSLRPMEGEWTTSSVVWMFWPTERSRFCTTVLQCKQASHAPVSWQGLFNSSTWQTTRSTNMLLIYSWFNNWTSRSSY